MGGYPRDQSQHPVHLGPGARRQAAGGLCRRHRKQPETAYASDVPAEVLRRATAQKAVTLASASMTLPKKERGAVFITRRRVRGSTGVGRVILPSARS